MPKDPRHKKELLHWEEAARIRREHQASQRLKRIIKQNRIAEKIRDVVSRDFVVFDSSSNFIPEDQQITPPATDELRERAIAPFKDLETHLPDNPTSYWATGPDGAEYN